MKTTTKLMLAGGLAALCSAFGAAQAAPSGRAILYEYPNFQGRSMTVYGSNTNLGDTNFNDIARSGHFDGDWTLCSDSDFRGQCQRVSGDVPDLTRYGLSGSVSSLRQSGDSYGDNNRDYNGRDNTDRGSGDNFDRGDNSDRGDNRGYPGGGYPGGGYPGGVVNPGGGSGGWGGEGTQGRSVVFYPRPQSGGQDIAAFDRTSADWFCRRQGLGAAVYFDTSTRGRGWRWQNGGFSVNSPVLRDVLCRKY